VAPARREPTVAARDCSLALARAMRAVSGGAISFAPTSFLLALKGGQGDNLPARRNPCFQTDASSFFSLALPGSSAAKKRRDAGGLNPEVLRFDKSYRRTG